MMTRLNQILAAVLVLQLALIAVVFWPRGAEAEARPLLEGFDPDAVTRITLREGGDEIVLARQGEGWVLPNADDYPVLENNVPALLEEIAAVETDRLVTETAGSHAALQVSESNFVSSVTLETADGETYTLYAGSSASAADTHVRLEGQDQVYLTNALTAFDLNPRASAWVNTQYLTIPADEMPVSMTLKNTNGTFAFSYDAESETWSMAGLDADPNRIRMLYRQASTVVMNRPLGTEAQPRYGLDTPSAVLTVETEADSYTLAIGAELEAGGYAAKAAAAEYYVALANNVASEFIERTQEDFLVVEQPAAPEGDGD